MIPRVFPGRIAGATIAWHESPSLDPRVRVRAWSARAPPSGCWLAQLLDAFCHRFCSARALLDPRHLIVCFVCPPSSAFASTERSTQVVLQYRLAGGHAALALGVVEGELQRRPRLAHNLLVVDVKRVGADVATRQFEQLVSRPRLGAGASAVALMGRGGAANTRGSSHSPSHSLGSLGATPSKGGYPPGSQRRPEGGFPFAAMLCYHGYRGNDEAARDSHARVAKVRSLLRGCGVSNVWWADEQMRGGAMLKGDARAAVDSAATVVCFVTRGFLRRALGRGLLGRHVRGQSPHPPPRPPSPEPTPSTSFWLLMASDRF